MCLLCNELINTQIFKGWMCGTYDNFELIPDRPIFNGSGEVMSLGIAVEGSIFDVQLI